MSQPPLRAALAALASLCLALAVPAAARAAVAFDIAPAPAYPGETVSLTDQTPGGTGQETWDLDGDGVADAKGPKVTTSYATTGLHPVTLTVSGQGSLTRDVRVVARPHAAFGFSPAAPVAGAPVTFTSRATPGGLVQTWDLDGDGAYDDASGASATATFAAGTHVVGLRVSDGRTVDVASATVQVAPAPAAAPVAHFRLAGPASAGAAALLDGSGSTPSAGARVIAYLWDLNGDGHVDADTGAHPSALFRFGAPGAHDVGLAVEDSSGRVSPFDRHAISIGAPTPGCLPEVDAGWLSLLGACIHRQGSRYTLDLGAGVTLNGIQLSGRAGAQLVLDTGGPRWTLSSRGEVLAQLLDTPAGTITLFRRDLGAAPITLPAGAARPTPGAPGLLLGSFPVAPTCPPSPPGPVPDLCATLPGGFPLVGEVALYLTAPHGAQPPGLDIAGRASMNRPFSATGEFTLLADRDTGARIDSFAFHLAGAELGVGRLDRIDLGYTRRAADGSLDVWEGTAQGFLHVPGSPGVQGRMRFADGRFAGATLELTRRVVLAPGVSIDALSGALAGSGPLHLAGTAALSVGPGRVSGSMTVAPGPSGHLEVKGALSGLAGLPMPSAAVDLLGGGGVAIDGQLALHVPSLLDATAGVSGFYTPPAPGQAHGHVQLDGRGSFSSPLLSGSAELLANESWIAGCGQVHAPVGPSFRGGLAVHQPLRGLGDLSILGGSCDLGPFREAAPASAAAAGRDFRVPAGVTGLQLEAVSRAGTPRVRVTGPGGVDVATPALGVVRSGPVLAVAAPPAHAVSIHLSRPRRGRWHLASLPGTPAITDVRMARELPAVGVDASVAGHGARRVLVYRIRRGLGASVRFVERGAGTAHDLGAARGARGRLRFTPAPGGGARRVVAVVTRLGRTVQARTVARYRAVPDLPGRPGRVRLRRRGARVDVTWGRARGAADYLVDVRATDGRRVGRRLRRRALTLRALPPGVAVRVTVRAAGRDGLVGRGRSARLGRGR